MQHLPYCSVWGYPVPYCSMDAVIGANALLQYGPRNKKPINCGFAMGACNPIAASELGVRRGRRPDSPGAPRRGPSRAGRRSGGERVARRRPHLIAAVPSCSGALVQRCLIAAVPYCSGALLQRRLFAAVPNCSGALLQRCLIAAAPFCSGALSQWCLIAAVPYCSGALLQRCLIAAVSYCSGAFL